MADMRGFVGRHTMTYQRHAKIIAQLVVEGLHDGNRWKDAAFTRYNEVEDKEVEAVSREQAQRKLRDVELFAWIGEDEFGSGEIGLKQGTVPAGTIPMVTIQREKLEKYWPQAEAQAAAFGKKISFCRFQLVEVLNETKS